MYKINNQINSKFKQIDVIAQMNWNKGQICKVKVKAFLGLIKFKNRNSKALLKIQKIRITG